MAKRIGFIGNKVINSAERAKIEYIGTGLALLGHTLIFVPTKGATAAIMKGVGRAYGKSVELAAHIIEHSETTFIYGNPRLLGAIKQVYPDLETRNDVIIIQDLDTFVEGIQQVLRDKDLKLPN